jgi:hypothetical protein
MSAADGPCRVMPGRIGAPDAGGVHGRRLWRIRRRGCPRAADHLLRRHEERYHGRLPPASRRCRTRRGAAAGVVDGRTAPLGVARADGASRCSSSHLRGVPQAVEHHLVTAIGSLRLVDLSPGHAQRVLAHVLRAGLTESTARRVRGILSSALKAAMLDCGLPRNVASLPKAPKSDRPPIQAEIVKPDEARRIAAALDGHVLRPLGMFAASAGMGRGSSWRCAGATPTSNVASSPCSAPLTSRMASAFSRDPRRSECNGRLRSQHLRCGRRSCGENRQATIASSQATNGRTTAVCSPTQPAVFATVSP